MAAIVGEMAQTVQIMVAAVVAAKGRQDLQAVLQSLGQGATEYITL
jgi:hypothetical protein